MRPVLLLWFFNDSHLSYNVFQWWLFRVTRSLLSKIGQQSNNFCTRKQCSWSRIHIFFWEADLRFLMQLRTGRFPMLVVQQWSWMTSTIQLVLNQAIQVAKLRIQEESQKANPKTNNNSPFKRVVQVCQIPTPGLPQLANLAVSGHMTQLIGSNMMFGNHRISNPAQVSGVPHKLRHLQKRKR